MTSGSQAAGATGSNAMYEVFKWKLSFDNYRDRLPSFYNDYLNAYMKFL